MPRDRVLPDVQRPLGVRRSSARSGSRTNDASCSSARSSSTRTSTGSRRPGAASRATCRTRRCRRRQGLASARDRPARREMPGRVEHHPELPPDGVAARARPVARARSFPSWPEGLGRVVLEAFARGRTAVATNAGGIRDIVTDGHDGILDSRRRHRRARRGHAADARGPRARRAARRAARTIVWRRGTRPPTDFARVYRESRRRALAGAR